jgi:four helix bundle protein
MTVRSYRDLLVWQRSVDLTLEIYDATDLFPRCEVYGLAAQLRRAAVSITSNIAEGHGRHHLGEYLHHLSIANGSLMELETQVIIAGRRGYLKDGVERRLLGSSAETGRLLAGLTRSLERHRPGSARP